MPVSLAPPRPDLDEELDRVALHVAADRLAERRLEIEASSTPPSPVASG